MGSIILFTAILGLAFFLNLNLRGNTRALLTTFINTTKAKRFFLSDGIHRKKQLSFYILIIGTTLGVIEHIYALAFGEPAWEGNLEEYSSLLFLFTAIILIFSLTQLKKGFLPESEQKKILFFVLALVVFVILIYGEEISWGQQFFGWKSTGVFEELNNQGETNIHNFFNPLFKFLYPAFGLSFFILLVFLWFFPAEKQDYLAKLLIPHPSLFFLALIMAGSSFFGENEIFEELFSIFLFLYSIRILVSLRFPNDEFVSQEKQTAFIPNPELKQV